ncbi:unnamed protein product [Pedinophyceae sp. YPF-701]|nr:unnamed protein product [Pedinophyceae sp. YPF-701]
MAEPAGGTSKRSRDNLKRYDGVTLMEGMVPCEKERREAADCRLKHAASVRQVQAGAMEPDREVCRPLFMRYQECLRSEELAKARKKYSDMESERKSAWLKDHGFPEAKCTIM